MARYYSIVIQDDSGNAPPNFPAVPGALVPGSVFTSFVNGKTDYGALDIEIDAPVTNANTPTGDPSLAVWGISLKQISQASNLNGKNIWVYGGMQASLPFANPNQSGLLFSGRIFFAFGNWIGTDMTLNLVVRTGVVSQPKGTGGQSLDANVNFVHNLPAGQPLQTAVQQTLKTAMPGYTIKVNISPNLVLPYTDTGYHQTMSQYARYIFDLSKGIMGGKYLGATVLVHDKTITVSDGTQPNTAAGIINYVDLIGQPTWYGPNKMQIKTVMRADLLPGQTITLPKTIVTTTGSAYDGSGKQSLTFQGKFQIIDMRHVGRFRQPDAASWNTTFNMTIAP